MTPTEIAIKAKQIETPVDLLCLINDIRVSSEHKNLKKISLIQLAYYCNPNSKKVCRFRTFSINKKSGGKRNISAPLPKLKAILWPLNEILGSLYEPASCVMGFTKCKSIVDNAKAHLGQNYILNLDLKDFFPSIHQARIWRRLQLPPFSFNETVASIIAGLCSIKTNDESGSIKCVLPQGAPTSPILTNIICEKLDRQLTGVAKRFNLRYTRYADDITFSCMHNALKLNGEAYNEICRVIHAQGFSINEKKTRLLKKGTRQEVTGLILSNKINVTRSYVRELDQILYIWQKFGYDKALARLYCNKTQKTYQKKSIITLETAIQGKLEYLRMVKGKNDRVYQKYCSIFNSLCKKRKDISYYSNLNYIATYPYNDFISLFNAEIIIQNFENHFFLSELKIGSTLYRLKLNTEVLSSLRTHSINTIKNYLYISLCRDDSRLFWLCHNYKPKQKPIINLNLSPSKIIKIWEKKGIDAAILAEKRAEQHNAFMSLVLKHINPRLLKIK